MNTMLWAVLGVAVGLLPLLAWLWRRSETASAGVDAPSPVRPPRAPRSAPVVAGPAPAATRGAASRKFHGVSVKPGPDACPAVQALVDQRFLPDTAPPLPLAACDQKSCKCAYRHHGDRRDEEDRRSGWGEFGGFAPSIPGGNRRAKTRDRRRKSGPAR